MKKCGKLICDACQKNEAIGIACVPMVPCSMAYCKGCLEANSHPMNILIANTACIDGLDHANEFWKQMVMDSLKHQGKTLEWFNKEVEDSVRKMDEAVTLTSEPIFINPKFNPEWAKPHGYEHSSGYLGDEHICLCGEHKDNEIHN